MTKRTKQNLILSALISIALIVYLVQHRVVPGVTVYVEPGYEEGELLGLSGYDAVAYFQDNAAVRGKPDFTYRYRGVSYYFANEANQKIFSHTSQNFLPQFGGFCALGVAMGKKLPTDPEAFTIIDSRLYLNVNKEARTLWLSNVSSNIHQARINWPEVRNKD